MSVVRSSGVSAIQGLLMYMEKHSGHFKCPLRRRYPQLRGVRQEGFHCSHREYTRHVHP